MPSDGQPARQLLSARALDRLLEDLSTRGIDRTLVLPTGADFHGHESETGWVIFSRAEEHVAIAPPLPIAVPDEVHGFAPNVLLEQIESQPITAIILIRLGRYAVGLFHGHELVSSKTEARYVGGQHKAGGWSQKRFVRIREKQIRELYDTVCLISREKLAPQEAEIERLWLGGDRHVLNGFLARCPWLKRFEERISARRLNVPKPDLDGLRKSIHEALGYLVLRLPPDSDAL